MTVGGVVFVLVVAGLVVLIIVGYNKLVGLRVRSDEAWSDIDVQLKRRTDLVPNLVETVKGYAAHERTTLDAVTRARGAAVAAQTPERRAQAENALTGALRQLVALAEAYPDLKANQNFIQLQGSLSEIEDAIQSARRYFNAVVRDLNTSVQTFPSNFVASFFQFRPRGYFELDSPQERQAPPSRSGAESISRALVAPAILLAVVPSPAAGAARGFAIANFVTSLQVNPDASLLVREDVTFEFQGAHQGVYRTIPVRYDRGGLEFALRLEGIGVYDEANRPLRHEVSYPSRYVRITAWVPGATDTKKTVTFIYRVRRAILAFEDHDELYWNATGHEWEVPIQHAEVYVNTPPGVSDKDVRTAVYTGPRGSVGQDYRVDRVQRDLRLTATRPLRPREGMTVVVGWPPGSVGRPTALAEARWFVSDNWPFSLPLLAFGLGWLVWWAYGRDPAATRSVKPEYDPPPGLIPAEAGTLVDEKAEPREVLATIVDLAVRGYLQIEQITTAFGQPDFMFKRLKPICCDPIL